MTTLEGQKLYTIEEFHQIAELPENADKRLELIEGAIYDVTSFSQLNTVLTMLIAHLLMTFVYERKLGLVSGPDGGYKISEHSAFQPDVGFFSKGRITTLATKGEFPFAPDLAIEVISPGERPNEIQKKVNGYLKAGTRLIWQFFPEDRFVEVIRPAQNGALSQTVELDGTLDGGDVLPGFTLPLKDLFAQLDDLLKVE